MTRIGPSLGVFAFLIIFLFPDSKSFGQSGVEDSLIHFSGHLLDSENNGPVKGKITYEKLPYGDDYGIASSDSSGKYEMYLIANRNYTFTIKASGYKSIIDTLKIIVTSEYDSSFIKDFYLNPGGVGQIIRIKNLYFEQSTSEIPTTAIPEINSIVQMLKENPKMVIQLEGHTDFRGNAKLNLQLSEERVETIRNYMYSKGVDKKRIKLKAYGGSMPLSKEDSEEARKANRRVEVRVLAI